LLVEQAVAETTNRLLRGDEFILDAPREVPAVWGGASGSVVWARGEGLMLVGPDGVGKTTLAGQLALGAIGLFPRLLGMRLAALEGPVLYLALDRPAQAARSFARMVDEKHRELLRERLIIWKGPLPFNVVESPSALAGFARQHGASCLFIDSLKDLAMGLSKDEAGSPVNSALQAVVADGIELCVLHHQRKEKQDGSKPKKLADVYGSRWLTAGMGSVVLLWGEPGDLVVEFSHLKQPAEEIGPMRLLHDHERGRTIILDGVDLLEIARRSSEEGLTAERAAGLMFETEAPSPNQVEKARRRLQRLVAEGLVQREGERPDAVIYRAKKSE
jgi:replicative DNA helicase